MWGRKYTKQTKKRILDNLSQSIETTQELSFHGRFYSLNTKNGRFSFESIGEEVVDISGKFDENIIGIIQTLTFEQAYEITVERKIQNGLTKTYKPTDTIIDIKVF